MSVKEAKEFLHKQAYDFIKGVVEREDNFEYVRYEKNTDVNASF
jgi:hypothetical protein